MGNGKFIIMMVGFRVETESHKRQSLPSPLTHDQEAQLLKVSGEVVGGTGQVHHDGAVSMLAKAYHLVVLADHLGSALGEVQGKRRLVCAQIIDIEYELFGEVLRRPPDYPANPGVDL